MVKAQKEPKRVIRYLEQVIEGLRHELVSQEDLLKSFSVLRTLFQKLDSGFSALKSKLESLNKANKKNERNIDEKVVSMLREEIKALKILISLVTEIVVRNRQVRTLLNLVHDRDLSYAFALAEEAFGKRAQSWLGRRRQRKKDKEGAFAEGITPVVNTNNILNHIKTAEENYTKAKMIIFSEIESLEPETKTTIFELKKQIKIQENLIAAQKTQVQNSIIAGESFFKEKRA